MEGELSPDIAAQYDLIVNPTVVSNDIEPLRSKKHKDANKNSNETKKEEKMRRVPFIVIAIRYILAFVFILEIIATYASNEISEGDYFFYVTENLQYDVLVAIGWNEIDVLSVSSTDVNNMNDKTYYYSNECPNMIDNNNNNNNNNSYFNINWCQLEFNGYIWLAGSIIKCLIILFLFYLYFFQIKKKTETNIYLWLRVDNCNKSRKEYKKWYYKLNKYSMIWWELGLLACIICTIIPMVIWNINNSSLDKFESVTMGFTYWFESITVIFITVTMTISMLECCNLCQARNTCICFFVLIIALLVFGMI